MKFLSLPRYVFELCISNAFIEMAFQLQGRLNDTLLGLVSSVLTVAADMIVDGILDVLASFLVDHRDLWVLALMIIGYCVAVCGSSFFLYLRLRRALPEYFD